MRKNDLNALIAAGIAAVVTCGLLAVLVFATDYFGGAADHRPVAAHFAPGLPAAASHAGAA